MPQPPTELKNALSPVCGRMKRQAALDLTVRCLAAGAAGALVLAMCRAATDSTWPTIAALVVLGVSPLAGLLLGLLAPPDWKSAARAVDDRYGLADRTTTALAVYPAVVSRPMARLVLKDAAQHLGQVKAGDVVRLRLPRGLAPAIALAVVALVVALVPLDWSIYFPSEKTAAGPSTIAGGDDTQRQTPAYDLELLTAGAHRVVKRTPEGDRLESASRASLDDALIVRRYFGGP
jgi:hypothetical protein